MVARDDGVAAPLDRIGVFSRPLARLRGLQALLGARRVVLHPSARQLGELDAVVGWGHKPTADRARAFARRHGVPYVALEDGFLRSVGLGADEPPLSLVVDDRGIYYDARSPSRLEELLAADGANDPLADRRLLERARACRERISRAKLSKYNHTATELPASWRHSERPTVLVVDQTLGDASVQQGLASRATFSQMLAAALDEHPDGRIIVKVHPDTVAGKKHGYLADRQLPHRVERLAAAVNPVALLEQVDHVYVCTSQLGFEALLLDKPVTCFGAPFYSGWGLTCDHVRLSRRGRARTIEQLAAAALLLYPRYLHPLRDERCAAEAIIEHLALQRRRFAENARSFYCVGFSTWKRPYIRRYLASPGHTVGFVRSFRQLQRRPLPESATVVLWGTKLAAERVQNVAGRAVPVWRMEDGFLRSVRLGSELTPPGSLVLDRQGLYYDPRSPSDLETILQEASFSKPELERAAALRQQIVAAGVSKYNVSQLERFRPQAKPGQPVLLVPGQVEDDASVRLGSPAVRDNLSLLRAARTLRPNSYIVYKPHPDVLSGNRRGPLPDRAAGLWDELVLDVSLPACLDRADEVHTMTSLVGFEALLRGLDVVTHGQPFYAGWGLTDDQLPLARRTRRLSLDELVAGALFRYPRYVAWEARAFCTAEDLVSDLARRKGQARRWSFQTPWVIRRLRDLAMLSWEWMHA